MRAILNFATSLNTNLKSKISVKGKKKYFDIFFALSLHAHEVDTEAVQPVDQSHAIRFTHHMTSMTKKFPGTRFALTCAFAGGLAMFVCMAAGELFADPEMFRGFLKKPTIWPMIFVESAIWVLPFIFLILPLLNRLKNADPKKASWIISLSWIVVGLFVAIAYKLTYHSSEWSFIQLWRPDIVFGWILPYLLILATFVYLSQTYIKEIREQKS
jgi:hypothetical protein